MTQCQDGEEGEGMGDTRKLKVGWGTGFSNGKYFSHPPHQTKTSFSSFCEGQTEVLREENWE